MTTVSTDAAAWAAGRNARVRAHSKSDDNRLLVMEPTSCTAIGVCADRVEGEQREPTAATATTAAENSEPTISPTR